MSTGLEKYQNKIIALIGAVLPNAKILLYGSRARGDHLEFSDMDIALDCGEKISRFVVAEVRRVIDATDFPYKVDVVDIHSVPNAMRQEIEKDAIVWKK